MLENEDDFDPNQNENYLSDGSWRQERKFVLSQLAKHERSIHRTRTLMNAMNLAFLDQMHKFDIKITKLTIWQTIILASAAFIAKWIFKV
jgi:hypothetical protein